MIFTRKSVAAPPFAEQPASASGASNGRSDALPRVGPTRDVRLVALWSAYGPYLVASVLLALGYVHYAPGTAYSLSAAHYRAWAFPAFRYSDIIWLYLRDGLDGRPLPYVDYPLEYPPLTGLLSWLLSWAPGLPAYFALAYAVLAGCALLAIWALRHLDGVNVWFFAASPALFFYAGHQWDLAAIGVSAAALVALQRGRAGWGIAGLVVGTSLKLFPVVFVAAAVVERVRDRRYRSAAAMVVGFAAGTLAINLPVALASFEGWRFFFAWNRDRLADSGIWVLWRDVATADLTRWSLVAVVAGGVALTAWAMRTRGRILLPLGATYLLWWLLVNKTFTTHLMLWAVLSLAILSAPWWLWALTSAADLVGFQLANYLNLYNVREFQHAPLIRKAVENIYDPVQIGRSSVLLVCALWGVRVLRLEGLRNAYTMIGAALYLRPQAAFRGDLRHRLMSLRLPSGQSLLFGAGLILAFVVATVIMTWPYALHLGEATIVGFDPLNQIWMSEWIQHALHTNPAGLFDANIFYPHSRTLAYTDANIPGALLAAPVRWLTGDAILTNSLVLLGTFVLAAAGVYALVVYLTGNRGAAFVTGIAYAFLPYRMVHLWHLNWLDGAWLPWLILALIRLVDRPSPGRGVVLGVLATILLLTSFYFSVQIALICAVVVLAWAVATRRLPPVAFLRNAFLAVALTVVIVTPYLIPYLQVREEQQLERTSADTERYKALPESYLQLAPWDEPNPVQRLLGVRAGENSALIEVGQAEHADGHQHQEVVIEDALYPGAIAAGFAIVGIAGWRRRRWLALAFAAIALVAVILSLGPTLGPRHGDGPPLPYGWLFENISVFRAMRVAARLGGLVDLMIVLLAGLGIAVAWDRLRASMHVSSRFGARGRAWAGPLLTTVLALAVLTELWTGAVPLEIVARGPEASTAARWLAAQPDGPVMEFPAENIFRDPAAASVRRHYGDTMYWSTVHWKPLVNGNSGFFPPSYNEFIERFVGRVKRPEGRRTPHISHVNAETVRLLQQLGVRYLIFHRSQYRDEDWPSVETQLRSLVEAGALAAAGEHGEATIFVVNPAAPPVDPPRVSLYAPTLATPASAWAPWVAVENRAQAPSLLAMTRPPVLEATWYDIDGRRLWSGSQPITMPVVIDEPRLLCGVSECLTARPFDDLSRLPPPNAEAFWLPTEPGHYIVRLRLSGDHPLDCRVDLDVVADIAEIRERSRGESYRWAECIQGHPNPVNDPGALPFALSPPSVTLIDEVAVLDIAVTPRREEELRGWFTLAPPGSLAPWREAIYQSPVQQRLLLAGEAAGFEWSAPLGTEVAPGIYGLTVWFHTRGPGGWEHAAGGDIKLAPIVVSEDGRLRWAGPVRVRLAERPPPLQPGQMARLKLAVDGTSARLRCTASWSLYQDIQVVASGNAGPCQTPEIAVPATVPPGPYRLQVDALAETGDGGERLSDAISIPVTVTTADPSGRPS